MTQNGMTRQQVVERMMLLRAQLHDPKTDPRQRDDIRDRYWDLVDQFGDIA